MSVPPPENGGPSLADALAGVRWDDDGKPAVSPLSPTADFFDDFPWEAGPRRERPAPKASRDSPPPQ